MHYPVITLKRLADKLNVSASQALVAINQLVEAGILIERTGYRRNRIYAAEEVLNIVNRSFDSTNYLQQKLTRLVFGGIIKGQIIVPLKWVARVLREFM